PNTLKRPCGLVFFYAPYCPHCKVMRDEWEKAAKISGFCDFYAFNCVKYNAHVQKIREDLPELIRSYPSIVMYKNGDPADYYDGERKAPAFVKECMKACQK